MSDIRVNKLRMYDQVFFETVGVCNAKCRYCVTGRGNHPAGGFIDVGRFQEALDVLFKNKLIHNKTCLSLYNWGEFTLHPEMEKIIEIIQNAGGGGGACMKLVQIVAKQ